MKFTVNLSEQAEDDLANWWLEAVDRSEINHAEATAHRALATDPHLVGLEIVEGLYVLDVLPLRFYFEIDFKDFVVEITSISRFKK